MKSSGSERTCLGRRILHQGLILWNAAAAINELRRYMHEDYSGVYVDGRMQVLNNVALLRKDSSVGICYRVESVKIEGRLVPDVFYMLIEVKFKSDPEMLDFCYLRNSGFDGCDNGPSENSDYLPAKHRLICPRQLALSRHERCDKKAGVRQGSGDHATLYTTLESCIQIYTICDCNYSHNI
ncbi:hypothetical protein EVAR_41118_1 [Eumeta japonica]|uniref:Uncharacterized protein n=1 Tax=Eumeta variegata TaxID=151549 RepID=A0A4C1XEN8_EUMVA|nr:hypothetical protein EVAR_41118_1 [Eumeta japonica]